MFDKLKGVENDFWRSKSFYQTRKPFRIENSTRNMLKTRRPEQGCCSLREYKQIIGDLDNSHEMLKDSDPDIKEMARDEIEKLNREKNSLICRSNSFFPKNPMTTKTSFWKSGRERR